MHKITVTLCILGNFYAFLSFADFFSKSTFWKNSYRNSIRVTNRLDPDQARHFVGPDLGPNCCKFYRQTTLGGKELNMHVVLTSRARSNF